MENPLHVLLCRTQVEMTAVYDSGNRIVLFHVLESDRSKSLFVVPLVDGAFRIRLDGILDCDGIRSACILYDEHRLVAVVVFRVCTVVIETKVADRVSKSDIDTDKTIRIVGDVITEQGTGCLIEF